MFIKKFIVQNIRAIEVVEIEFPKDREIGWHVLLGENGSGKTTILQSIAVGLLGKNQSHLLTANWMSWLQLGKTRGGITVEVIRDETFDSMSYKTGTTVKSGGEFVRCLEFIESDQGRVEPRELHSTNGAEELPEAGRAWPGWFSAGYGAHRRFEGADSSLKKLLTSNFQGLRHATLFYPGLALDEYKAFLTSLHYRQLEESQTLGRRSPNETADGELLENIKRLINESDFLPSGVKFDRVDTEGVWLKDQNKSRVEINDLGDGYKSVLSLFLDVVFWLRRTYEVREFFDESSPPKIVVPGVVLIDEPDAHLHPRWQRRIGKWFRDFFPNMQFIVATHSPLICQSAEVGTIWRLPDPGTREEVRMADEMEHKRIVYGNVLEAYGTGFWGHGVSRSDESQELLDRLARLNRKELDEGLSEVEEQEQDDLRAIFPTTPAAGILDGADHTEC
jgi:energy-coupling factor transporter ATP-binding protein EcfA2